MEVKFDAAVMLIFAIVPLSMAVAAPVEPG
jgi:hypothetical protein